VDYTRESFLREDSFPMVAVESAALATTSESDELQGF
jgi:hypothetical protein